METKVWIQIEDIFHTALGLTGGERDAYLTRACSNDAALRAEVESLLAAFERQRGFIEEPVLSLGMKVFADGQEETLAGKTFGPYRVLESLGRGGMGEVYLAEDTRLGRKVALKFISAKLVDDNWAKRQLIREAQAAAMLDHPNICAVHGIEEMDGHSFIVMQYVEGRTIDELLHEERLEPERVVRLSVQIVSALAEAQAHGIIHRDVKPQNIVVTESGYVKVLDFGLAKITQQKQGWLGTGAQQSEITQRGLIIGTVAYMSPEQLKAERLDYRSDVFSCGTVLYEMLSGRNPYARESNAETISAILTDRPAPLTSASAEITPELSRIVLKCLEKDKERRYQSASELLYDLNGLLAAARPSRRPQRVIRRLAAALTLFLLLLIAAALIYQRLADHVYTLAVLPINNETADASIDYLSDGLAESIIHKLSRLPRLRVKALTMVSGHRGRGVDPGKVGRDLKVDAVLTGIIVHEGDSLVLRAALVKTADGSPLWEGRYSIDAGTLPAIQDMTEKIAASLQPRLGGDERKLLAARDTEKQEALRHYLRGRHYWRHRNKDNILKAIESFNAAIEIDPAYARAYAGLADCYVLMNTVAYGNMETKEAMARARWAAKEALKIDDTLPEAHTSLAVVYMKYDWNWQEAENELRHAISLNPDYAPARYWHSNILFITGRQSEAIAESEVTKDLDPFSPSSRLNYCRAFYHARQYDRAAACLNNLLAESPENIGAQYILGFVYEKKGMKEDSIRILERLYTKDKALAAAALGYAYGKAERQADALRVLSESEELARHSYFPPFERAVIYTGLNDKDNAFAWLEKAYEERFATIAYLVVDPAFDTLRHDHRFSDLVRRLNLIPLSS